MPFPQLTVRSLCADDFVAAASRRRSSPVACRPVACRGDACRRPRAASSAAPAQTCYSDKLWALPRQWRGFTLLELLSVIAIIGILAALIFPGVGAARRAANKAKTKVQFSQWAAAIEGFRSEYGYYPALHSSNLVNPPGQATDAATLHLFHDILAAKRRDGSALPVYSAGTNSQFPESQNRKLISFHSFSDSDFTSAGSSPAPNLLRDAFDNTEIAVLVDRNLDGVINSTDYGGTLPLVGNMRPAAVDFPAAGVRAGVIFYAPAPGADAENTEFIFSWK